MSVFTTFAGVKRFKLDVWQKQIFCRQKRMKFDKLCNSIARAVSMDRFCRQTAVNHLSKSETY